MKKRILIVIGIIGMLGILIFVLNHMEQPDQQTAVPMEEKALMKLINGEHAGAYQDGYYYIKSDDGDHIMYFDYKTQKEVYLCNKPNCKHEDASCSSYLDIGELNELFYYDSHLYLVNSQAAGNIVVMNFDGSTSSAEEGTPTTVYRMNLDGTDKQKLFTVPDGTQLSMPYIIRGDTMYAFLETYQNEQKDQYSFSGSVINSRLIAIDLANGSYQELADGMNHSFLGVYHDKIVLQEMIYAKDPKAFDDDPVGYVDNLYQSKTRIKLLDIETKQAEVIYEDLYKNVEQMQLDKEGIYLLAQNSQQLEYLDIATKEKTEIVKLPQSDMELSKIIDDKLLVYHYKDEDAHIDTANVIDLKTRSMNEFRLKDKNGFLVTILADNDTYYFVETDHIFGEEYTTWAGTKQQDMLSIGYALIKKADYWASQPNYIKMSNAK